MSIAMTFRGATAALARPTKSASHRALIERLTDLGVGDQGWSWSDDLALSETLCRGAGYAQVAEALECAASAVRSRWSDLKRAACDEGQPFGLAEQEALLLALRDLAVRA